MHISDDHVEALRLVLAGEMEEYEVIADRISRSDSPRYFNAILASAFAVAIHRRFARGFTAADVIRLVADQRARIEDPDHDIDPMVAEQLTLSVLTGQPLDDLEDAAKADAQIVLLLGLVEDADLDDAELDEFVEQARGAAEELMPTVAHLLRGSDPPPTR